MKRSLLAFSVLAGVLLTTPSANAATIVWDLNCVVTSTGCDYVGHSWGTVRLEDITDDALGVAVTVDLVGAAKVQSLYLNFGGTILPTGSFFTANGESLGYSPNGKTVQGSGNYGYFDLENPARGNLGSEPYIDTLMYADASHIQLNLDALFFNYLDSRNLLPVAVHIGGIQCPATGCLDGTVQGGSIAVGATSVPQVPEPATMLLLGVGLLGAGFLGRRKK